MHACSGLVLALPFDLTLPFARYIAHNNIPQLKRYDIAKVYRKNPVGSGHPRELYECDFDIVGAPPLNAIHDAEVSIQHIGRGRYNVKGVSTFTMK